MTLDTAWAWCRHSLTIAWARFLMVIGLIAGTVLPLLEALGTVDLTAVLPAKYVSYAPLILALIGVVTELCRRRSLVEA